MNTRAYGRLFGVLSLLGALTGAGCAGVKPIATGGTGGSSASGSGGTTASGGATGSGGTTVIMPAGCNGPCTDFEPTADNPNPIFGVNVPTSVAGMFGTPSGNGPCVTEPEDGALFPNNWLPPRIHVPGYSSSGFLKITFHADMESTDLVAYSQGDSWALPKPIWQNLAQHIVEQDVTVTVQTPGGGATVVHFQVAPVGAGGSMVFWSADPNAVGKVSNTADPSDIVDDSKLLGFSVGDNGTVDTLTILQVQQATGTQGGNTQPSHCIGCHVGTPDGSYVAFVDAWPWSAVFAGISPSNTGDALPNYLGATCSSWNSCTGSRTFMQYPWGGGLAMSAAHWPSDATTGERIAIMATQLPSADTVMPWNTDDYDAGNLVWIDTQSTAITMTNGQPWPTQGTAYGYMQHTGDLGGVAFPTWSNDGNTIVYASTAPSPPSIKGPAGQTVTGDQDGRLSQGATDLYSVPYDNKAGGAATPVPGASSSALDEYYPAFSPDDSMLAFTAIPSGPAQVMYANPQAELYVVPFGSPTATAVRLNANDPPSCTGMTSPGINNHWPKWAPDVENGNNGKTYYWLIFSSNRYGTPPVTAPSSNGTPTTVQVSQLYITAIVQNELTTATYPSIYLYNQPSDHLNTTPAWQDFHIPIVIDRP